MNITFVETEIWEQTFFSKHLEEHTLTFFPNPLDIKEIPENTEILSPFIYSHITKEILEKLPHLKLIATRSTGIDHIDIHACQERNIIVKNVPSYGIDTIAEHTFALILALTRKILPSTERTRKGSFSLEQLRGFELSGKTIGIVGLGTIGMRVLEIAHAFKMKAILYSRTIKPELTEKYNATFVDFPSLLKVSDIVTLHVPQTPETHHLINRTNIGTMKKGSYLINTARGPVVETEAILWALEQGILNGVGLDVLEEERALKEERELLSKQYLETSDVKIQLLNHVLLNRDDVIITPHNAFNSQEALQEILDVTVNNIKDHISLIT